MSAIISAWKHIGETPLQCLMRVQEDYSIPETKSCYTGRLDPMAQGIIVLLYGDYIHLSPHYNSKSKTYIFQCILGISTGSYDAMSMTSKCTSVTYGQALAYQEAMLDTIGNMKQSLPPCSAYRYKGKPLWIRYRDGTLPEVLPTKDVTVYGMASVYPHPVQISLEKYKEECFDDLNDFKVQRATNNDFPVDTIMKNWKDISAPTELYRLVFKAPVSSGTFVRGLAHDVCASLGIPSHAFRITRVEIK